MEFLRAVAKAYISHLADEKAIDNHTFIFPNRRSLLFFQKYLGQEYSAKYGKPMLSPNLQTINDFIISLGGLKPVGSVKALYTLYRCYSDIKGNNVESFDDFVYWGDIILRDFDDIDKYLVNATQLFTNIKELKELSDDYSYLSPQQIKAIESFWGSFSAEPHTEKKEVFFSLWKVLESVYDEFRSRLESAGEGYEGMIYRKVAEQMPFIVESREGKESVGFGVGIGDFEGKEGKECKEGKEGKESREDIGIQSMLNGGRVVFVGLNAPNMCERKIMRCLMEAGKADFYWDYYGKLLTDSENEAGTIIRGCVEEFKSLYLLEGLDDESDIIDGANTGSGIPHEIEVYAVPSGVGQALVASKILEKLPAGDEAIKTCIQLPDENMLMPLLNSVPDKYGKINVTMGYPLVQTSLYSFVSMLASLVRGVKVEDEKRYFYYNDLVSLLAHPYINGDKNSAICREAEEIKKSILGNNLIFVPEDSDVIEGVKSNLLKIIFNIPYKAADIPKYQLDILKELDSSQDSLTREFLYRYALEIKNLAELEIDMEVKTYFRLLARITAGLSVSFIGEPLNGLQIMGSLETRAIDFDNLIILSANEGTFPSAKGDNSLIPYNLRVGFALPTYRLHDSIASYHFYRSICRVKNLYIIYDTRKNGLATGEVSRFVKQLKYQFNIDVKTTVVSYAVEGEETLVKEVEKGDAVMAKLRGMKFSASAINDYFICPLKFYIDYVIGYKDKDDVSADLEADKFGNIYHNVMEAVYAPFKERTVNEVDIKRLIDDQSTLNRLIKEQFMQVAHIGDIKGRRVIEFELLKNYLLHTLRYDLKNAPFHYVAGEERKVKELEFYPGGDSSKPLEKVQLIGFIDRKHRKDGRLYIIDYKTGFVEPRDAVETDMETLFDMSTENRYHIARQLQMYAYLNGGDEDTVLSVYYLRQIKSGNVVEVLAEKDNLVLFENKLRTVLEEIFNRNMPFSNSPGCEGCKWCSFSPLCNK